MTTPVSPPLRHWRWITGLALLAVIGGGTAYLTLAHRVDHRIAAGVPVTAEVTRVEQHFWERGRGSRVVVAYHLSGPRTARLSAPLTLHDLRPGDRVTVWADARGLATADGLASEDTALHVPVFVALWGVIALVTVASRRGRWWWRHERRAPLDVPLLDLTWTADPSRGALPWLWTRQLAALESAPQAAASENDLRVRLWLRLGHDGEPEIDWFSRRSRRLTITVPVPVPPGALDVDPRAPLRAAVAAGVRAAAGWGERRDVDLSGVRRAARVLGDVTAEELLDQEP